MNSSEFNTLEPIWKLDLHCTPDSTTSETASYLRHLSIIQVKRFNARFCFSRLLQTDVVFSGKPPSSQQTASVWLQSATSILASLAAGKFELFAFLPRGETIVGRPDDCKFPNIWCTPAGLVRYYYNYWCILRLENTISVPATVRLNILRQRKQNHIHKAVTFLQHIKLNLFVMFSPTWLRLVFCCSFSQDGEGGWLWSGDYTQRAARAMSDEARPPQKLSLMMPSWLFISFLISCATNALEVALL